MRRGPGRIAVVGVMARSGVAAAAPMDEVAVVAAARAVAASEDEAVADAEN